MQGIDKHDKILYLPLPRSDEEKKWCYLREKLRQKKQRYIDGIQKFGTVAEAMIYAGINNRQSLSDYRNSDPAFAEAENAAFEAKESDVMDMAIKGLFLKIQEKDLRAITYYLDRRNEKFKPKGELGVSNVTEIQKQAQELNSLIERVKINNVKAEITTIEPGGEGGGAISGELV